MKNKIYSKYPYGMILSGRGFIPYFTMIELLIRITCKIYIIYSNNISSLYIKFNFL